ncbi:MAG: cytochrome c oxidase subunit II [Pseudomonadota bacterium]
MLTACSGPYSMLDPAGPAAQDAAFLWWGMFAFFTLVLVLVIALWVYALRRDPKRIIHDTEARKIQNRWILGGGIVLPVISIIIILFFGIPAGHRMLPLPSAEGDVLQIDITGRQWQWEVSYPGTGIELIDELHIPAGVPVNINLTTADVIHSFWIPRMAGKMDTIPGRVNTLRIEADQPGLYGGQCAEFCGVDHAHMKFTVKAHTPEDFERWLKDRQNE